MIYFARRLFGVKKIGHAGTLDPMATGVLPLLVGSAAKLSGLLSGSDKTYRAVLKLGISTDTMDTTGNIIKSPGTSVIPGIGEVKKAAEDFVGEVWQVPPLYSAIKIRGKKLYEYARNGIEINPEARKINIYSLTCEGTDIQDEYILNISCSKGTYIRSVCHDIGEKLKCGGVMAALERTRAGDFDISESYTPEYLGEYKQNNDPANLLIPCEDILKKITSKKITLGGFYSRLARNGAEIYLHKIDLGCGGDSFCAGDKVLMYDCDDILLALGEIKDYPGGTACKPGIFV
jgi:tRNA pseudouridine55 synthase